MAREPSRAKSPTRVAAKAAERPFLQILVAAVGLVMTLWAAGVILGEALQPGRPTALSVSVENERLTPTSRIVEVIVKNEGSETAASVEITGAVGGETASATIDYVPGDGEASASLSFPAATTGSAEVTVSGWTEP